MFKTAVLLLMLNAGISFGFQNNGAPAMKLGDVQKVLAQKKYLDSLKKSLTPEQAAIFTKYKPVQPIPQIKKPAQFTMLEEINRLADKVIKTHGVEIGNKSPENIRNVERLKEVVATVEFNVDSKVKEMQQKKLEAKHAEAASPATAGILPGAAAQETHNEVKKEDGINTAPTGQANENIEATSIKKVDIKSEEVKPPTSGGEKPVEGASIITSPEISNIKVEKEVVIKSSEEEQKAEVLDIVTSRIPAAEDNKEKIQIDLTKEVIENETGQLLKRQTEKVDIKVEQYNENENTDKGDVEEYIIAKGEANDQEGIIKSSEGEKDVEDEHVIKTRDIKDETVSNKAEANSEEIKTESSEGKNDVESREDAVESETKEENPTSEDERRNNANTVVSKEETEIKYSEGTDIGQGEELIDTDESNTEKEHSTIDSDGRDTQTVENKDEDIEIKYSEEDIENQEEGAEETDIEEEIPTTDGNEGRSNLDKVENEDESVLENYEDESNEDDNGNEKDEELSSIKEGTCSSDTNNCDQESSHIYSAEYNEKIDNEDQDEDNSDNDYLTTVFRYLSNIFVSE